MDEEKLRQIVREEFQRMSEQTNAQNQFAVANTSFHAHNGIDSQKVKFTNLLDAPISYYQSAGMAAVVNSTESALIFSPTFTGVSANTNGVTNVDVFTNNAPLDFTITGIFLTSLDVTAGDITVLNAGNTVATIAKGTTAGALVGATTLANASVAQGASFQVDSSSTGNATVFIIFTV